VSKFLLCLAFTFALPLAANAQQSDRDSDWRMPRTEFGHPDLQGTWFFGSRTPFQRPADLGEKRSYSEQEVLELESGMRNRLQQQDAQLDPNRGAPEQGARIRQEADDAFLGHWLPPEIIPVNGEYRTSVIIDPPNGRLPTREGFQDFYARQRASGLEDTDGPEGQPISGRCLMFGPAIPSLTPVMMNPNLLIVQNEDYVVIQTEMIHDARIIRLNAEHLDSDTPRWMGDSVGYWDGDTLVVHTQNFRPEQSGRMFVHSGALQITERYTLVGDGQILYSFTAEDEAALTQAVTAERILTRNSLEERVYEYGCHEGNHSLVGILRGARFQESLQASERE